MNHDERVLKVLKLTIMFAEITWKNGRKFVLSRVLKINQNGHFRPIFNKFCGTNEKGLAVASP